MIEIEFGDVKPGQHFGVTKDRLSKMKLDGWVVNCIPDEEYGNCLLMQYLSLMGR